MGWLSDHFSSEDVAAILGGIRCFAEPCGSRVTCDPAPQDTDADYLVELIGANEASISNAVIRLSEAGFRWEGSEHYQQAVVSDFMSWRKDDVNLIVSANVDFIRRHRAATALCKRLNLLEKSDRVALFQAVLYGNETKAGVGA